MGGEHDHPDPAAARPVQSKAPLDRSLIGALPCVSCGYDLQGISVLSNCPECGTAVRATILSIVDPLAEELRPMDHPRLLALGLMMWSVSAMLACLVAWSGVAADVVTVIHGQPPTGVPQMSAQLGGWLGAGAFWIGGVGGLAMVKPNDDAPRVHRAMALLSVLLAFPAGWVVLKLGYIPGNPLAGGLRPLWEDSPQRTALRAVLFVMIAMMISLMRPNGRMLVARSLAMRLGRVDRQTLAATAVSAGLIAAADVAGAVALRLNPLALENYLMIFATVMMLGWTLLSIGVAGSLIDAARIARAIVTKPKRLDDLLAPEDGV